MLKLLPFFSFLFIACSSACAGDNLPPAPIPPISIEEAGHLVDSGLSDAKESQTFDYAAFNFRFTLPNSFYKESNAFTKDSDNYFASDANGGTSFLASRENGNGTLNEFTLLTVRSAKESGMSIVSQSLETINNISYSKLIVSKQSSLMWILLRVSNNFAYTFACKTQSLPENQSAALCQPILNSIVFNDK